MKCQCSTSRTGKTLDNAVQAMAKLSPNGQGLFNPDYPLGI
jgi:hypothetical protein